MKNQEILNQMYDSMLAAEEKVEEKVFIKVMKKVISKVSLILGVTTATFAFLATIFEIIIIICNYQNGITTIIDKLIPVAVIWICGMIIYSICLEVYKRV